ncbi:hypothetical protein QMZ92_23195 [Streptomyces sp. HNM0645]|uniref:hypothetical protein n=1 Tax=Streptomyces sp. HNM0645 TaxID=2782343 RepID=UPI0024B75F84|nr:hypothetical protein [Streptomyces sp. HNM0645]MDI9887195.1 hypothetical protein [Streptomyces sp. HNM0645]
MARLLQPLVELLAQQLLGAPGLLVSVLALTAREERRNCAVLGCVVCVLLLL